MVLRFSALPLGLRHSVLSQLTRTSSRNVSNTASKSRFASHFFTRIPTPARPFRRHLLWLIPTAGAAALLFAPKPQSLIPAVFASPTLIPCNPSAPARPEPTIFSPAEPERRIIYQILDWLNDKIWEPLLTGRRFIYLLFLFVPVLVSAPMVFVGHSNGRLRGDRWGAVWWYGFLTTQMQRAGPTFVKASTLIHVKVCILKLTTHICAQLAQWAASRADLFPTVLCDRLGSLHSSGKPHSLRHTKHVIERIFQRPFHEVFEEFDAVPIGCGAIAQVYRATLKKDLIPPSHLVPKRHSRRTTVLPPSIMQTPTPSVPTATVAVKVLHPKVEKIIRRDLKIMSFFAHALSLVPGVQWLSLPEEVDVFGKMMHEQLDLRIEADNLIEFETKFQGRNLPVTFPRPLKMWSTRTVLVEEFQNALPLETFMRNGGGPYNDLLAEVGLDAFLNMLLLDNFVHSDLHPGNIMIKFCKPISTSTLLKNVWSSLLAKYFGGNTSESTTHAIQGGADSDSIVDSLRKLKHDPAAWRRELHSIQGQGYLPEIVFIDAGLVTTLDAEDRRNFLDLFRAVAEFDGYRAGQLMVSRCRTPELAIETETFALKMQNIVLNVKRKTFSLGQIKISDILTSVLTAVRQHHVKMEADFINTVISILLLEGIGRQLDPNLDLFKSALPILRQLGRKMSTQENLKELPSGNVGAFLKLWVWMEARELASSALVDADELVRRDWLTPGI
ncbi:hypothetical protein EIP91_001313 [Steccherinum ochraceum]|uniref:ABC1 atypical kinase-like domain-containing protein n=1 Tax=Steccherinum ochraceum TaxID=92696 RepID=A0A4R0RRM8_9APHY|nr:hypothetical protein EIP91_001313 [Steccherinum ochraceum]